MRTPSILLDILVVAPTRGVLAVLMVSMCCLHLCGLKHHRSLVLSLAGIIGFRRVSGADPNTRPSDDVARHWTVVNSHGSHVRSRWSYMPRHPCKPAPTRHDVDGRPEVLFLNVMPVGHDLTRSLRLSFLIIKRRKQKYLHYKTRYLSVVYPHLFSTRIFTKNRMKVFM
jgi:hypothetical protein